GGKSKEARVCRRGGIGMTHVVVQPPAQGACAAEILSAPTISRPPQPVGRKQIEPSTSQAEKAAFFSFRALFLNKTRSGCHRSGVPQPARLRDYSGACECHPTPDFTMSTGCACRPS